MKIPVRHYPSPPIGCGDVRKTVLACLKQAGYTAKIEKDECDDNEYVLLYLHGEKEAPFSIDVYTDICGGG